MKDTKGKCVHILKTNNAQKKKSYKTSDRKPVYSSWKEVELLAKGTRTRKFSNHLVHLESARREIPYFQAAILYKQYNLRSRRIERFSENSLSTVFWRSTRNAKITRENPAMLLTYIELSTRQKCKRTWRIDHLTAFHKFTCLVHSLISAENSRDINTSVRFMISWCHN